MAARTLACSALLLVSLVSCVNPGEERHPKNVGSNLAATSPPSDFERPKWVRTSAEIGAAAGGLLGGVLSICILPITYPISLATEEHQSADARMDFLLFPMVGGASIGHVLVGAPLDSVDLVCRRVWVGEELPRQEYQLVEMKPPVAAEPAPEAPPEPITPPQPSEPVREEQKKTAEQAKTGNG